MLYKMRYAANIKFKKLIYYSFFQTHIQYCITSYASAFKNALNPIIVAQKYSLRLIKVTRHSNLSSNLLDLKNLSFNNLCYYRCLCYLRKHPDFIQQHFKRSNSIRQNVYVPLYTFKSTRGQNSFLYRCKDIINLFENIGHYSTHQLKKYCLSLTVR